MPTRAAALVSSRRLRWLRVRRDRRANGRLHLVRRHNALPPTRTGNDCSSLKEGSGSAIQKQIDAIKERAKAVLTVSFSVVAA